MALTKSAATRKTLDELDIKPEECLFVGDWVERDILEARNVVMRTCLARYGTGEEIKDMKADYEINYINEILKLVR